MKKRDSDGLADGGKLSNRGALSRRDFGKLSFGTLGTILPGARLMAANTAETSADDSENDIYISPAGSDRNSGTQTRPFATMERARDHIQALKRSGKLPKRGMTVWLRGGVYELSRTFKLGLEDSGSETAPIAYRAYPNEKVFVIGGRRVSGFAPISDAGVLRRIEKPYQDKILQLNLKSLGITDFGTLVPRGFGIPIHPAALELFFEDLPMTLAQWPNAGWAKVAPTPGGGNDDSFTYDGDRPLLWREDDDAWLHGYWNWDWADTYLKLASIEVEKRQITTDPANGARGQGFKPGQRYYALNILEELDAPGEWYLDRHTGVLYFWPPEPLADRDVYVSLLEEPLVQIENASHITLRGLTFEFTRGSAVEVSAGSNNLIAGCAFKNIGTVGVKVEGGVANGVVGCDISETGEGGIILSGGDRQTLTPAGNYAINNCIDHFSRWVRTYRPAINLQGVGNRVAHNLIYDAPHVGILVSGNNHTIEFNEIHNVALETSDVGAIYMGRDYTQRGNIIRYNYIHDLPLETEVNGVYLDDCWSGTMVYGNIFYRMHRGILVGGGRDNTVDNNILAECHPAIHVDARGLTWARFWFDGRDPTLLDRLRAVPHKQPPYSVQYPQLVTLWQDEPALPKGNSIVRNVCYGGQWLQLLDGLTDKVIKIEGNYIGPNPGFVDLAHKNFQLRDDSPAYPLGFKRVPLEKIGLYSDEYRTVGASRSSGLSFTRILG